MQPLYIVTALLLVASISAEHVQEVSNVQPAPVQVDQPAHVVGHHQGAPVEGGSPQVFGAPHQQQHHPQHQQFASASGYEPAQASPHYYAPAGMMYTVGGPSQTQFGVGAHHQSGVGSSQFKPTGTFSTVGHYAAGAVPSQTEQYGQPESASVPPNYKPFGSWGLYIGGNPADGYYTNYYKALSNSVADKQQVGGESGSPTSAVVPASGRGSVHQQQAFVSGAAAPAPSMRQGPFYPSSGQAVSSYQDQTYQGYPYGEYYTPADLNSGSRVQVQSGPSSYSSGSVSPTVFGGAMDEPAMYFAAEHYSKKSPSSSSGSSFSQKEVQVPASPAKGYYQQRAYQSYQQHAMASPQQATFSAAPVGAQVVAYPVPVGSQMVGSQPGVEGAFAPYGVHAFTRYAVKPTVVSAEQTSYYGVHSAPASHFPVYKQSYYGYPQPLGFYGFPLSQLHYSNNAASAAFAPVAPAQVVGQAAPVSPAAVAAAVAQQQQQQQQQQPHSAPEPQAPAPAPVVPPAASAPAGPAPAPAQAGPEPAGPVPVVPVDGPVVPFEVASSEKSETSHSSKPQMAKPEQKSADAQQKRN